MADENATTDDANPRTDDAGPRTNDMNTGSSDANTGMDNANTGSDDADTGTDDANTRTDDVIVVPEGGWGWMVTLAGFVVAFIVDGMVASFGLLIPELLVTFEAGMALTSWPPVLLQAMYQLSGPVTAYLVQRWGCRGVGMCGGLLAAVGVGASAFAPSIQLFILSFGFLAGVGVGLIYLPSITMVNLYFHKKRGMVTGIITSGSGFGLLALAPLTEMLMAEYGWRGCYLIMAAITLHFCVCACLMRPLPQPHSHPHPHPPPPSSLPHSPNTLDSLEVLAEKPEDTSVLLEGNRLNVLNVQEVDDSGGSDYLLPKTHFDGEGPHVNCRQTDYPDYLPRGILLERETEPVLKNRQKTMFSSLKDLFLSHHGSHAHMSTNGQLHPGQDLTVRSRSQGHLESSPPSHRPCTRRHVNVFSTWLHCQVPPSLSRHSLHSQQSSNKMAHLQGSGRLVAMRGKCQDEESAGGHSLPSVLYDEDGCKHGVLNDKLQANRKITVEKKSKEATGSHSLSPQRAPEDLSSPQLPETQKSWRRRGWMRENRVFLLFLIGAFLIQLVCNVPPLLAPSFAYQSGISKEESAVVLSVYGVLNTVGRLVAGVLVYWGVGSLQVYNVGTLLSAVACFTFPLSTSFPTLALTLGLHGFFLGAFPPLQSVILVEYLGLHRLTSTFGIMCMVKAFASAAGAPLAGLLVTVTGTYTVPVAVCGGVLVLAAIVHQLMNC